MDEEYWKEIDIEEIYSRDKWQIEIKSEFLPAREKRRNEYCQEFYFFIPNALQVNERTYSKSDFYASQTNLLRFKTPQISLKELIAPNNRDSPIQQLKHLLNTPSKGSSFAPIIYELKLFGNIMRSRVRERCHALINSITNDHREEVKRAIQSKINSLITEIYRALDEYDLIKAALSPHEMSGEDTTLITYIQDGIANSIIESIVRLLEAVRQQRGSDFESIDKAVCALYRRCKKYQSAGLKKPQLSDKEAIINEEKVYQDGLLKKFIFDALSLRTRRKSADEKYRSVISSAAAAMAMLLYLTLLISQGAIFVFNSLPFLFFTILIYVLKDRLKEELKSLPSKSLFRWFPDYITEILTPQGVIIGKMSENFSFLNPRQLPADIEKLRNQHMQPFLEGIRRPEQILYYKRKITIFASFQKVIRRLEGLNLIFRHDIHKFLEKGSNPYENQIILDDESQLHRALFPKVYHINIVIQSRFTLADGTKKIERKKFRLIATKEGIRRSESLIEGK